MVSNTSKDYAAQSVFKQFIGHPQADLSDLSHSVYSNDDVTQNLGELVFPCRTVRAASDVRVSNLIGAFFIGLLGATFGSIVIAMLAVWLGLIEKHVAALLLLGGTVVFSPIAMALSYWISQRQFSRCRFDLHDRGIRYVNHYWQAKDIVAINAGSSVQGLDERTAGKLFFLLKPRLKRGMKQNREHTLHLKLSDGTRPNLIIALSVFEESDVWELLCKAAKLNPRIKFDPGLSERLNVSKDGSSENDRV